MRGQAEKYELNYQMAEALSLDMKMVFITDRTSGRIGEGNVHMHSFWELIFVREGSVLVHIDDCVFRVERDEILLIPPNVYHATTIGGDTRESSVHFAFEKVKHPGENKLFDEVYSCFPAREVYRAAAPEAGMLLEKLFENQEIDRTGKDARIQANIIELVFYLYDMLKPENLTGFDPSLQLPGYWSCRYAVETLLCRYYQVDISQEALCARIGISTPSLTRVFTSVYGRSFGDLKLELKIRNAKRLIRETNFSIGEIGRMIGYTSARGFLIAFRRSENCTPSEYRQKIKGE